MKPARAKGLRRRYFPRKGRRIESSNNETCEQQLMGTNLLLLQMNQPRRWLDQSAVSFRLRCCLAA